MSLTLYGLDRCGTCVKARAWLDDRGVAYRFQDYRDVPVAPDVLRNWAKALGGWEKLVNRASLTWRNLDASLKSPANDAQWLDLIARYPALVRRPVAVFADGAVTAGFSEKRYLLQLGLDG